MARFGGKDSKQLTVVYNFIVELFFATSAENFSFFHEINSGKRQYMKFNPIIRLRYLN